MEKIQRSKRSLKVLQLELVGAVLLLGLRTLSDIPAGLTAVGTIAILLCFKKLPEPLLIAGAAILGLILKNVAY